MSPTHVREPQRLQTSVQAVSRFNFSVGSPYCWCPKKSYFRFQVTLVAAANDGTPLSPSALTTLADNACGNLYNNMYLKAGSDSISQCTQYTYQASALKSRIERPQPFLRSMGSSAGMNEASFQKRLLAYTRYAPAVASMTGIGAYDDRDVYRPYLGIATTPISNIVAFSGATVTLTAGTAAIAGGITVAGTDFATGMPNGSAPAGGPVLPGDIIVIVGVPYTVLINTNLTTLTVTPTPAVTVTSTDWFIVRSDTIRAPQSQNSVMVAWQPPLGIMNYDGYLGSGQFSFVMNPDANFELNAVETKNPNWSAVRNYKLNIEQVQLFVWQQKMSIPEGVTNYFLDEYQIDAKPYGSNVTFDVPVSTRALIIFVQDLVAGGSPLVPPSMFKVQDNGDLTIQSIQIQYANINKPATPYDSKYLLANVAAGNATSINWLQQRYHDNFYESGLDVDAVGCETFQDWMRRGPFYYFAFDRDMSNHATSAQVSVIFANANLNTSAKLFCAAIKRRTAQITTSEGRISSVVTADA